MKYASDFRAIVREALRGKWVIAVIVGLVAALLGSGSDGPRVKLNINDHGANLNVGFAGQTVYSTGGSPHSGIGAFLIGRAIYIVLLALEQFSKIPRKVQRSGDRMAASPALPCDPRPRFLFFIIPLADAGFCSQGVHLQWAVRAMMISCTPLSSSVK